MFPDCEGRWCISSKSSIFERWRGTVFSTSWDKGIHAPYMCGERIKNQMWRMSTYFLFVDHHVGFDLVEEALRDVSWRCGRRSSVPVLLRLVQLCTLEHRSWSGSFGWLAIEEHSFPLLPVTREPLPARVPRGDRSQTHTCQVWRLLVWHPCPLCPSHRRYSFPFVSLSH